MGSQKISKKKDQYSAIIFWLTKRIAVIMGRLQQGVRFFCPPEVKKLRGPFIVCSNHVGLWDPFLLCHPFRNGVRYITSDAAFRKPLKGWFLRKLGCIPKTKGVRDSETIRDMIKVIKKNQVIGIFPEGDRSYDGKTMMLNDATGKLLKKMGVPVVGAVHHGTSLSHPRWSSHPNKGRVEYHYQLLFTPERLREMDGETIQKELEAALANDDTAWQETNRIPYASGHRAEKIEHPIFICPHCRDFASILSNKDSFFCGRCDQRWEIDEFGIFHSEGEAHHNNLRDWFAWQQDYLAARFRECGADEILFGDNRCTLLTGYKAEPLTVAGTGEATLTGLGLSFAFAAPEQANRLFPAAELKGITIQEGEMLEFYHGDHCFQFQFEHFVSACKWGTALEVQQRVHSEG